VKENGVVTVCRDSTGLVSLSSTRTTNASAMPKREIAINRLKPRELLEISISNAKNPVFACDQFDEW